MENPYERSDEIEHPAPCLVPEKIPTLSKAALITDLVMSSLRTLMIPLSLLGYMMLSQQDPRPAIADTALLELFTNISTGLCGLFAAILLLARRSAALPLAWIAVVCTILSMAVGLWQAHIQWQEVDSTAESIGFAIGAGLTSMVRIGLLIFYILGIRTYAAWVQACRLQEGEAGGLSQP